MERNETRRAGYGFAALLVCGCFALFVLWTELNPRGVACGMMSSMCGQAVRNASIGIQMYRDDHGGQLPADLQDLVPDYLLYLPECSGGFNGCRVITVFGLRSTLSSVGEPRPGPPAVPLYESYLDAEGKPQYRVVCERKHNGRKRYFSEGERFESVWNGQVRAL